MTNKLCLEVLEDRCSPAGGIPTPDHIVVVVEENHSYDEIIGNPAAPYINWLASQGALLTNSFAIEHPSEPNYLDLFSGSNQGVATDGVNNPGSLGAPNLASELLQADLTWGAYVEGLTSGVGYDHDHAPWNMFNNIGAPATIQDFSSWPTDFNILPRVSIVTPNMQDDMHTGSIQQGDAWLQNNIGSYAQWAQTHNSILIVTWDEDDGSAGNHIPTIIVGQGVFPGQYSQYVNTYGLLATIEDMYDLPLTAVAALATPVNEIWSPPQSEPPTTGGAEPPPVNEIGTPPPSQPPSLFQANLALFIDGAELVLDMHDANNVSPLPSVDALLSDIRSMLPYAGPFGIPAVIAGVNAANSVPQGP